MEGIYHDRQFPGLLGADTALDGPRMRPMRDTPGVQGDHPPGNMFTAHKIAVDIIQDLVTVDIAVIVGSRNRKRMIIKKPRTKRTDHIVMSFERLMHRRRLMHTPRDRF